MQTIPIKNYTNLSLHDEYVNLTFKSVISYDLSK